MKAGKTYAIYIRHDLLREATQYCNGESQSTIVKRALVHMVASDPNEVEKNVKEWDAKRAPRDIESVKNLFAGLSETDQKELLRELGVK